MKYRESGMPNEQMWDTFFEPINTLLQLGINESVHNLIDIGCGYGTFLLPASKLITGTAIGIDIDKTMLQVCGQKVQEQAIENIMLLNGDITTTQTINDLKNKITNTDYITMFNILHCEQPINLLKAAYNLLNDRGRLGVIHWIHEDTPRGPSMDIRPKPEMICEWCEKTGFVLEKQIDLPPYHYGLVFKKPSYTTPIIDSSKI